MSELELEVVQWLDAPLEDPLEASTYAAFRILAGPRRVPLTEVEDGIARTVRDHIRVSMHAVARWLLVHWWRLRWEPRPARPPRDWLRAHSMAAIGGDYAWPALQIWSDGTFVQLQSAGEPTPDVAAIRYLRGGNLEVPASDFERAVDRLLDAVEGRLALVRPAERELSELRRELYEERSDPELARACKLQALAGYDPGAAPPGWLETAERLTRDLGAAATDEVMAALPDHPRGLEGAIQDLAAIRSSPASIRLALAPSETAAVPPEVPWARGARLATELRARLGVTSGLLDNPTLEQLVGAKLPLPAQRGRRAGLAGGYRAGAEDGRTAVLVTSQRDTSQRFMLARLIGAAFVSAAGERLLPITDATTALQKFERAFAQELLCPWRDLDAFTDEHGTGEDGIAEAAAHFQVSEHLVLTTLVNKRKLRRDRLPLATSSAA